MTTEELKIALTEQWNKQKLELETAQKANASKEDLSDLVETVKTQGQDMADYIESMKTPVDNSFDAKFESFLNENKDKLADLVKAKTGEIEFTFDAPLDEDKVVGDIGTGSGGDVVAAPVNHNTQLNRIRFRDDNPLISMCNVIKTSKSSFSYTETVPKEGGYAFVAEGGTKPQADFKWEVRYANPYKVAAYEVFTEEVVTDIPRLMDTAKNHLKDKHDLFKVNKVYFGNGAGAEATGATVIARTFVAGLMALKVVTPTIMDVINACVTDIYTTPNYTDELPYMPNLTLLNPVDFFVQLQAVKDADGHPLFKGVTLFNKISKNGMTIAPWHSIPAGKIFVGDMSKMNLSNWVRYSVRLGWINEQFISNEFTMVGESRYHQFIKNLDEAAFIYDDFATIATAITKP